MKKVLLLITALLTAPGLVSADFWDELRHDANSVSSTVTTVVDPISKQITHVVNHQTTVYKKKDLPTINKVIKINHQINEKVLHTVTSGLVTICKAALGTVVGSVVGEDCGPAVTEFTGECSAELDAEAPEVGLTACTAVTAILTRVCKHELTQAVAGNAISQACESF